MPPKGSKKSAAKPPPSADPGPSTYVHPQHPPATLPPLSQPTLPNALKFTSFQVIGFLNGKNVAANYVKADAQSYWSRRPSDEECDKAREGKRRRLMASVEELEHAAAESGVPFDSPELKLDVLKSGAVVAPKPAKLDDKNVAADEEEDALEDGKVDPMTKTIVIHPGSRYLRIGRASDAFPITLPNVIATKKTTVVAHSEALASTAPKTEEQKADEEGAELPKLRVRKAKAVDVDGDEIMDSDGEEEDEGTTGPVDLVAAKISSIRGDLRARMRVFKLRGQTNANAQAIAYNEAVVPEPTPDYNDPSEVQWTKTTGEDEREFYVGLKALAIPDAENAGYVVRRPYDRGYFNTTGYSSSQEFLGDIERIWLTALEDELGITKSELKDYSAILIIPDLYDHIYVREMTDLILKWIGFKQVCLQQESICATFGAGLSTACVVDIGAKKTSITCIEEGLILPETRMVLDFAGDDITEFLLTLLNRTGFPYREANLALWHDKVVLDELKENIVVLSEADVGLNLYDFYVRVPNKTTKKYSVRVYDDCILAPYALFAPRVVDFEKKVPPQNSLWSKDVEDIVEMGGNAVTNAMRNSTRHLIPVVAPTDSPAPNVVDGSVVTTPAVEESNPLSGGVLPPLPSGAASGSPNPDAAGGDSAAKPALPTIDARYEASKLPLDVAVVESILAAGAEERMKKLCQNIIIVGGTGLIHNVGFAVESRVGPALAARMPSLNGQTTVVPPPREIDSRILAWKGISVLSKLDSAADLWIRREDWEALGLRAVKERCFFMS